MMMQCHFIFIRFSPVRGGQEPVQHDLQEIIFRLLVVFMKKNHPFVHSAFFSFSCESQIYKCLLLLTAFKHYSPFSFSFFCSPNLYFLKVRSH